MTSSTLIAAVEAEEEDEVAEEFRGKAGITARSPLPLLLVLVLPFDDGAEDVVAGGGVKEVVFITWESASRVRPLDSDLSRSWIVADVMKLDMVMTGTRLFCDSCTSYSEGTVIKRLIGCWEDMLEVRWMLVDL